MKQFLRYGFTLIELLVAMMIASMIGLMLTRALYQAAHFERTIDVTIDSAIKWSLFQYYFERDLQGVFIPVEATISKEHLKNKTEKKDEQKTLKQIFVGKQKENNLAYLSFITRNPLPVYVGEKVEKLKPRIARVSYVLKPEPGLKNSFSLMRIEGSDLPIESYQLDQYNPQSVIVSGIKTVSFDYLYEEKGGKETKRSITNEWVDGHQVKESVGEKKEQKKISLPIGVVVKLVLWDAAHAHSHLFESTFYVLKQNNEQKKEASELNPKSIASPQLGSSTKPLSARTEIVPEKKGENKSVTTVSMNRSSQKWR